MTDLLTPPTGPHLPDERKRLLKAHLLTAIETPARQPRRRRALVLAGGLLAASTVVLMNVLWPHAAAPPYVTISNGDHDAAVTFLGMAAVAADAEPAAAGGQGKYLYIRSRESHLAVDGDNDVTLIGPRDREIWIPLFAGGHGVLRDGATPKDLGAFRAIDINPGLPDDPDAMLRKVYADARKTGNQVDAEAFTLIGDYLSENETVLQPTVVAALYQAAARIPGVELLADAEDGAGRHGVAVARSDGGIRHEWIFDAVSREYLGARSYLVEDGTWGRAGLLLSSSAVLTKTVVDTPGKTP
ncbi:CU044_5270 family protein [Actinoplanes palleronii]|uniref:CU044_5270 family protein n=1 Tax=Actinoplanes palleronii TaxID=113570 RepID=A0ABQ4BDN2_9ACTN|nr:CU044_5270 family protein [Actinoplanes palleronii]GIE68784.1 hypothetical protein Apa02nite_048920 [Actinoplanes palleronii]